MNQITSKQRETGWTLLLVFFLSIAGFTFAYLPTQTLANTSSSLILNSVEESGDPYPAPVPPPPPPGS